MKDYITKGFDEKTLTILKEYCVENFNKNPSKCFIFHQIFTCIENSFDNQGMPLDIYKKIESLKPFFVKAYETDDKESLDELIKAFVKISPF